MATPLYRMHAIREAQARIRNTIAALRNRLATLQGRQSVLLDLLVVDHSVDGSVGYRTFREALRRDIWILQHELANLGAQLTAVQKQEARWKAVTASGDFKWKLNKLVEEGEREGSLDHAKLETLRGEAERALDRWIVALHRDPSEKNIHGVLEQLANNATVGFDVSSKAEQAWNALRGAAGKRLAAAEANFRRDPTVENFRHYLDRAAEAQQLGDEGVSLAPPPGLRRLRVEKTYKVAPGDSLASISRNFYGSAGYWDLIFFANQQQIGGNPDRLTAGVILTIP